MFFDNHIIISDYQDIDLNFKNYLKNKDSLIFKRCQNINITIDSKINKLIFLKSKNITLNCSSTICGIDIENCQDFKLIPLKPYLLNCIDCYRSHIEIHIDNINNMDNIQITNQSSSIKIIYED